MIGFDELASSTVVLYRLLAKHAVGLLAAQQGSMLGVIDRSWQIWHMETAFANTVSGNALIALTHSDDRDEANVGFCANTECSRSTQLISPTVGVLMMNGDGIALHSSPKSRQ